jgi:TetR/AcrR family fatty acid metabolism transcriptional regulator
MARLPPDHAAPHDARRPPRAAARQGDAARSTRAGLRDGAPRSWRAAARGGDKHPLILQAAIRVFARHGFFNSQVADVAREAGVAAGTVYLYFRSKDDLLASIFERTVREAIAEGRAALASVEAPIERLRAIARRHLELLSRDRDLAVVFQVELRHSTKHMEEFSATMLRAYLGLIRGVIAEGQAAGAFRTDVSATTAAKVLFGALDEMATNWMLSRRRYSLAAEADLVVELIAHGLAAPPRLRDRTGGATPGASTGRPDRRGRGAVTAAPRSGPGARKTRKP